ncbi:MAG TPA: thiopurine S-methyltransferase [Steroidobacteraceae bacterium]|nr:thiopurine S-methyltransferase [Steroidobacteraceae bacterium]
MQPDFWHNRWFTNQIGFHESAANPLLVKHIDKLKLPKDSRIFLPLCGKTLDIGWMVNQGYQVVGAELSKLAVDQLFKELGVAPAITCRGNIDHYHTNNIDVLTGDIFDITCDMIGKVDAIYDRAALVALPSEMRIRYTRHLVNVTNAAPQLLICFEYDQTLVDGPPFSVDADEVRRHYENYYDLVQLDNIPEKLRQQFDADEVVWLLQRNT